MSGTSHGPAVSARGPDLARGCGAALVAVAAAVLCTVGVEPLLQTYTVTVFVMAIAVAAGYGGLVPGLVATVASAVALCHFFVPPRFTMAVETRSDVVRLALFVAAGVVVSWVAHLMHRARAEAVRQAAAAIEAESVFRRLVEGVQDYAIFGLDPGGRVTTWNAGAERLKGYRADQVLGRHLSVFYLPEDREAGKAERELERAAREGVARDEGWRMRSDGSRFWADVVLTAVRDGGGRLTGYSKVTRDLTERRAAEVALRAGEARLAGVVGSAMDAIVAADGERRIVLFNPAAERLFGVTAEEALGTPLERFIPARFRAGHAAHMHEFGETGVGTRHMGRHAEPLPALRADGSELPVEATIAQVALDGGRLFTAVLRDVSARLRAEAELRELAATLEVRVAERTAQLEAANQDLEAYAHTAAHDLRAPARTMEGFAQVLLGDADRRGLDEEGREHLRRIVAGARRMSVLIDDLLAYSRLGRMELPPEAVPLDAAVAEALRDLRAEAESRAARVEVAAGMPAAWAHRPTLVLAVRNLAANALKFTRPGEPPEVTIRTEPRDGLVRLWVEDRGIGVPPAARARIWSPFERLHGVEQYPGTGVGLAVVRRAVERLGGRAGVEPGAETGSRFWIEVPAATPGDDDASRTRSASSASLP
jgi:PAS domain S-box-containing protein